MKIGKKGIGFIVLMLFCISFVVGCGSGDKKPAGAEKQPEKIVLRFGHTTSTETPTHKGAQYFADKVKEKTNGRVEVQIFPGGQLGGEKAQLEGLMAGTHDFHLGTQAPLSNWLPQFMALDLPYLISSEQQADKILNGEVGKYLLNLLPSKGLYGLGWGENGFRDFTNSKRPLFTPDDLKGLKIRVMENKLMIDTFKLWGCDPTPIPFPEVYTALQQKTVDGQENPAILIEKSRFYEVQKYLSITHHFYSPLILYASKVTMDKLPEDIKKAIFEAGAEACEYQKKVLREDNAKAVAVMEKAGIQVNRLTPEQMKVWADTSRPIYEMYKDKMGADIYEKVMAAVKAN